MDRVSSGTIILFFLAILCGLLGVFALRRGLSRGPREARAPAKTLVPMAGRDLQAGRKVTLGDVALMSLTKKQMEKRGIKRMFMGDPQQIIGRTLKQSVKRSSTFDTESFYPDDSGPGISMQLESGERAMTVSIFDEHAILGFAGAGQFVDVLFRVGGGGSGYDRSDRTWHPSHRQWNGRMGYHGEYAANFAHRQGGYVGAGRAVTLMQGVRVLALGDNVIQSQDRTKSAEVQNNTVYRVTLAVRPDQAEVLRVVEGQGELSLTLRNPEDTSKIDLIDSKTLGDILGIEDHIPREMQVYRGKNVQHLMFDRTGPLTRKTGSRHSGHYSQQENSQSSDLTSDGTEQAAETTSEQTVSNIIEPGTSLELPSLPSIPPLPDHATDPVSRTLETASQTLLLNDAM